MILVQTLRLLLVDQSRPSPACRTTSLQVAPVPLFLGGEDCTISLDRVYPSPGKMTVRLGQDPPAELAPCRSYALLFMRQIARGRWQFEWSLGATGYAGCPKNAPAAPATVDICRQPAFVHGTATADIRIVVARRPGGFEAESAELEVPTWSAPTRDEGGPSH